MSKKSERRFSQYLVALYCCATVRLEHQLINSLESEFLLVLCPMKAPRIQARRGAIRSKNFTSSQNKLNSYKYDKICSQQVMKRCESVIPFYLNSFP